jgi:hypothetical protein
LAVVGGLFCLGFVFLSLVHYGRPLWRERRPLRLLFVISFAAFLVSAGIGGGLWARSGWVVRAELERIREAGHALSPSDLMEESGSPAADAAPR